MLFRWIPARCASALLSLALGLAPLTAQSIPAQRPFPSPEILTFSIEWRLINAGTAKVSLEPSGAGWQTHLNLESAGLVSKLYRVDDHLTAHYENQFCIENSTLNAQEGKRRRDTHVIYDAARNKASYLERDLVKNTIVKQSEIDISGCVHDVVGALIYLRTQTVESGHNIEIPMSDGKKFIAARVEAQEREELKINKQVYKTIRYEAFIFNKVLYARSGRLLIWLTEDGRHLPVQIQIRAGFPIGTVTLQLDKQEIS
jgi:hypothetical protein